jgi:hypothetical protein
MLLESGLPKTLWGYAILHANYLRNRMHTRALPDKTPYEMIHHEKPTLKDIHMWGIEVYVKINQGYKLAARAKRARWIGISDQSHGHYIYWPDSQKVSVERNVVFDSEMKKGKVPIISIEESKLPTSSGMKQAVPAPVPVPNRLVSEGAKIKESDENALEEHLEELQPIQGVDDRSTAADPIRRSEHICQQQQWAPTGPVTRSQTQRQAGTHVATLVYEDVEDHNESLFEQELTSEADGMNNNQCAISAFLNPGQNNKKTGQDLNQVEPSNAEQALNSPI